MLQLRLLNMAQQFVPIPRRESTQEIVSDLARPSVFGCRAQAFAKNARNTSSHFLIFPSVRIEPAKRS
jgi:hypothetical protein